ncbi:MAG: hypothetical protein PHE59_02245 [Patescibacteria group bacterium]|nr:hypothetical protein [Patescibacteria group bacterium]MDD5164408.1 hypothetical protein [Patescibacteria group bacterium]MDD5534940.1 hypothetical protein [Patescibacteria group bacterium]
MKNIKMKIVLLTTVLLLSVAGFIGTADAASTFLYVSPTNVSKTAGSVFNATVGLNNAGDKVCTIEGTLVFNNLTCQGITLSSGLQALSSPSCSSPYFLIGIPSCTVSDRTLMTVSVKAENAKPSSISFKGVDIIGEGTSVSNTSVAGNYNVAPVVKPTPVAPAPVVKETPKTTPKTTTPSTKKETTPAPVVNSAKAITSFDFAAYAVVGAINEDTKTIVATLPYGTDVTALVPMITTTGKSVSPASGAAQDFSDPIAYTVTAEDKSTQTYTVAITVAANPAKAITDFSFKGLGAGVINETNHVITVTVPFGTKVNALTPTIVINGVAVSPASGMTQDFTHSVIYTVTAADDTTQAYTVTATVAAKKVAKSSLLGSMANVLSLGTGKVWLGVIVTLIILGVIGYFILKGKKKVKKEVKQEPLIK